MKVFKMIVTDIAVKQFGGLLKKLKDIIRVSYMLALEVVKWLCPGLKGGFAGTDLNTLRRNECFTTY